jgi:hypothetical protein
MACSRNSYYLRVSRALELNPQRTSCESLEACCHTVNPSIGRGGYASNRKCRKKFMSFASYMAGVVRNGRATLDDWLRFCLPRYSQGKPSRWHGPHWGATSSHLTLRFLQQTQPARDLVCPFLGIGFRLVNAVEAPTAGDPTEDSDMTLLCIFKMVSHKMLRVESRC